MTTYSFATHVTDRSLATQITDRSRRTAEGASAPPEEGLFQTQIFEDSGLVYDSGDIRLYGHVAGPLYKLSFAQDPGGKAGVASLGKVANDRWGLLKPQHQFHFSVEWDGDGEPVIRLDGLQTLWSGLPASGIKMRCSTPKWEVMCTPAGSRSTTPGKPEMVIRTTAGPLLRATRPMKDGRPGLLNITTEEPAFGLRVDWKDSAWKDVATETWEGESYSQFEAVKWSDEKSIALAFVAWCARIWYYKYVREMGVKPIRNMVNCETSPDVEGDDQERERRKRNLMERVMPKRLGAKKGGKETAELYE